MRRYPSSCWWWDLKTCGAWGVVSVRLLLCLSLFLLASCQSYRSFIAGLNERQLNSCVEGNLNVGGIGAIVNGGGMVHVYSATGGAQVDECIRLFRGESSPPQNPSAPEAL